MTKRYAYIRNDDNNLYYNIIENKCCSIDELSFEATFPTRELAQDILDAHKLSPLYEFLGITEVVYSFIEYNAAEHYNLKDDKYIAIDSSLLDKK